MSPPRIVPRLYLAGKIEKNCWRHSVVPSLRGHAPSQGALITTDFTYTGPFFVSCDHGCYHGPATHGVRGAKASICCAEPLSHGGGHRGVIARCLAGIRSSDLLFAYINARECYGTIAEIEHALYLKKHVVVAFAPGLACRHHNEFWFVTERANEVLFAVDAGDVRAQVLTSLRRVGSTLETGGAV